MQHENTSLRATISRQSQKIGRIENELRKNEMLLKDQGELQSTVEKQREKIVQYQREIEETKLHMARLEELVHQVQEQSMKEHVIVTPSVSVFFNLRLRPRPHVYIFVWMRNFLLIGVPSTHNWWKRNFSKCWRHGRMHRWLRLSTHALSRAICCQMFQKCYVWTGNVLKTVKIVLI